MKIIICSITFIISFGFISLAQKNSDTTILKHFRKVKDSQRIEKEFIYINNVKAFKRNYYYFPRKNIFYYKTKDLRNSDTKTEPWKVFYFNGSLKEEGILKNKKIEGIVNGYFENGSLKYTYTMKAGKFHGIYKCFYENHQPGCYRRFYEGNTIDTMYAFYPNGNKWTERVYNKDGDLLQISYLIDIYGKPLDQGSFKEGNGYINVYNEKGFIIAKEFYKNRKLKREKYY